MAFIYVCKNGSGRERENVEVGNGLIVDRQENLSLPANAMHNNVLPPFCFNFQ